MGHSTVYKTLNLKVETSEIKKIFNELTDEDRRAYGYNENCDSFAHAYFPSLKYLGSVYTHKGLNKISENLNNYESFVAYYVDYKTTEIIFKKIYSKIKNINLKLNNLINDKRNKLKELELNLPYFKAKNSKEENFSFLVKCKNCKSNINLLKLTYNHTSCPVCGDKDFKDLSYKKTYSSKYLKVEKQYNQKIEKLKQELSKLENKIPDKLEEKDIIKNKKNIKTIFFADVHS